VCDVHLVAGSISTILPPGVWSQILLNWALTPINAGRTTPWVTTDGGSVMPPGDLASLAFYHAFQNPDGSYVREKWLGCKSTKGSLKFTEKAQGRKLIFSSDFVGIKVVTNTVEASPPAAPDATEFPNPAETDYPAGAWLFSHFLGATGTCKIGSARTQLADFSLSWENQMDARTYESPFLQICRFLGRKVTAEVGLRYKPSPDDLAAMQSRTLQDSEFKLDNGVNTLKLDLNAKNRLMREREYADGDEYAAKLQLTNFWDPALATDIALTLT
jgi:hypothetical protein